MNNPQIRAWEVLKRIQGVERPVGVELGVYLGQMSVQLLAGNPKLYLFLVDSYAHPDDQPECYKASGDYHAHLPLEKQDHNLMQARHAVAEFKSRCIFYRMESQQAASTLLQERGRESLDFVFIDADHSYEGCKRDICAWWPLVRRGGWLSGHDYSNQFPGVRQAVHEFQGNLALELGDNFTWFMQKPK